MDDRQFIEVRKEMTEIGKDVVAVKQSMSALERLVDRLDTTIDKMHELIFNTTKIMSTHEARLEQQERAEVAFRADLREIENRLENFRTDLSAKLEKLAHEFRRELRDEAPSRKDKETDKSMIESFFDWNKWKWIVIGGASVLGFLFFNLELVAKLLLLIIKTPLTPIP